MKVLMVGQLPVEKGGTYTTGVCNVIYELSRCATKDVQIVVYATNMNDSNSFRENHVCYRGTRLNFLLSIKHLLRNPLGTIREWRFYYRKCHAFFLRYDAYRYNIERIIEEEKPDVIHCMSVLQMASCFYANLGFKLPIILTLHGNDPNPNSELHSVLNMPDVITGLTSEIIHGIRSHSSVSKEIVMIPNGVDSNKFYYCEKERLRLRKELGVDENTTVLLTIGALCHRKGQYSFVKKLKEFPTSFNYIYLVIGKGEDEKKLRSFIRENGLMDNVRMLGYVNNDNLFRYHSAADIYVHSSRSEGQALSEVEAYTTDLKIALNHDVVGTVISDTSIREDYLIIDVDNFDINEFVTWASLHKNNRKTRKIFDWNNIFEMYSECYLKVYKNKLNTLD